MEKTHNLRDYIEHTLLKPETKKLQIKEICDEAVSNNFFGVCVPQYYVQRAKEFLPDENAPKLVTVIGFPLGYNMINAKAEEAKKAITDGADELDLVMNIAAFKSENFSYVLDDIQSITTLCRMRSKKIKVIIETALLSEDEIKKACELCTQAEVDFVKTSTGFSSRGASLRDIELMREYLPSSIGIKASGGIKTSAFAHQLIEAGASRLGTSSGLNIIADE